MKQKRSKAELVETPPEYWEAHDFGLTYEEYQGWVRVDEYFEEN